MASVISCRNAPLRWANSSRRLSAPLTVIGFGMLYPLLPQFTVQLLKTGDLITQTLANGNAERLAPC